MGNLRYGAAAGQSLRGLPAMMKSAPDPQPTRRHAMVTRADGPPEQAGIDVPAAQSMSAHPKTLD